MNGASAQTSGLLVDHLRSLSDPSRSHHSLHRCLLPCLRHYYHHLTAVEECQIVPLPTNGSHLAPPRSGDSPGTHLCYLNNGIGAFSLG